MLKTTVKITSTVVYDFFCAYWLRSIIYQSKDQDKLLFICLITLIIHVNSFLCLCPLRLAVMLNFNISKVAYCSGLDNNIKQSDF